MREEAFERLYEANARGLLAFLAYRVDTIAEAEDLAAETFERAFRSRRRFDRRKGSEKTWLYAIASNVAVDAGRRRAAERRALDRVPGDREHDAGAAAEDAVGRIATRQRLTDAMAGLGEQERTALALRYGSDLTVGEVARVTGSSEAATEARIRRALVKLRDRLGDEG